MNRNQKIALGCGGAGCLGLIVVAIAGGLIYYFMRSAPARYNRDYNFNVSTNRNSNSNNSDFTTNRNSSSTNSTNRSSSDSSMSDDDKHKLYQAASMTGDAEVVRRVSVKIGIFDDDYTPGDHYQAFVAEHVSWAIQNTDFITSVNTPEKARAYINEHMN